MGEGGGGREQTYSIRTLLVNWGSANFFYLNKGPPSQDKLINLESHFDWFKSHFRLIFALFCSIGLEIRPQSACTAFRALNSAE